MTLDPLDDEPLPQPALAQPRDFMILADLADRRPWNSYFRNPHLPLEIEYGCGGGEFAVQFCARYPERNLIAIERKLAYLKRGIRKARGKDFGNLVWLNTDGLHIIREYFPDDLLDGVHIYCPDPWPKKRHAKRRLFQQANLDLLVHKLKVGGRLYVRTDVAPYFAVAEEILQRHPALISVETPTEIRSMRTNFETKFLERGITLCSGTWEKVSR